MSVTNISLPSAYAAGVYTPVFDSNGTNGANHISGEVQTVAANFGSDLQVLVPSYAPFYAQNVTVTFTDAVTHAVSTLTVGVDFFFGFPFLSASRACQLPVYGAIVIANNQLAGTFSLVYHTVGGIWSNTVAFDQGLELLSGVDPYATAWEQVTSYNQVFPNVNGPWDKTDPSNIPSVISSLLDLTAQINTQSSVQLTNFTAALAHLFATDNPHDDTAAAIGLGNVDNYLPATNVQAADFTNTTTYVTPAQLSLAFASGVAHASDTVSGLVKLNDNSFAGDATDSTKTITALGFINLVSAQGTAINLAFNKAQQEGTFSPYPFTFPKTWNGVLYSNMTSLLAAIGASCGIFTPLEFSSNTGKIWFPAGTTVPNLTVS